jgi:hypothetical protein
MKLGNASVLWAVVMAVAAAPAVAQQGSLTLKDADVELCHRNETAWTISKDGSLANGQITWTVTVTKGNVTPNALSGFGFVRIFNSGSANATLGNIVVNLQRRQGNKWVTASSDVANATSGDAATNALVVKGASSEGKSSFTENEGSGPLSFTDANSNSIFSLVPQFSLPAGQALDLLYHAEFDNSFLQIPAGELVRFEVIVSFGNAGARGGSGATGSWIDINGNGTLDSVEKNVRSVPSRLTRAVPALEECAKSVLLSDTEECLAATGTVVLSGFSTTIGGGLGTEVLTDSAVRTTWVQAAPGLLGGQVTNTATLDSPGDSIVLEGPLDLLTGLPIYSYEVECCPGLHLEASDTVLVPGLDPEGFPDGSYTTFSHGGWSAPPNGGNPGALLVANFAAVYPEGVVEVGIPLLGGFSMTFTSPEAVQAYIKKGDGTASSLTADLNDPTSSSSGVFGVQVLALRLSVDFSDKAVTEEGFGDLVLYGTGGSLDGQTVSQILSVAETALGGGGLPSGYTFDTLNTLIDNLNRAFDNGNTSSWAQDFLSEGT